MNLEIRRIIIMFVLIFCQTNCFFTLMKPKFGKKTSFIIGNIFAFISMIIFTAISFFISSDTAMSLSFVIFFIPSIVLFMIMSKYKDGRFWFTFCSCDVFFIMINSLSGVAAYVLYKENHVMVTLTVCLALITSAVLIILFLRKPLGKAMDLQTSKWGLEALVIALCEVAVYMFVATPNAIYNFEIYNFVILFSIIIVLVAISFIHIMLKVYNADKQIFEAKIVKNELEQTKILLEQREKQYFTIAENIDKIRYLHHEMRHQMVLIKELIKDNNYDELEKFVDKINEDIDSASQEVFCQDYASNLIITYYKSIMDKEGIRFECNANIPQGIIENNMNKCVILGNILENAIEACQRMDKGMDRFINLEVKNKDNSLIIKAENSFDGIVKEENSILLTRKNEDNLQGLGLNHIQNSAKLMNGFSSYKYEGNIFRIFVKINGQNPIDSPTEINKHVIGVIP